MGETSAHFVKEAIRRGVRPAFLPFQVHSFDDTHLGTVARRGSAACRRRPAERPGTDDAGEKTFDRASSACPKWKRYVGTDSIALAG